MAATTCSAHRAQDAGSPSDNGYGPSARGCRADGLAAGREPARRPRGPPALALPLLECGGGSCRASGSGSPGRARPAGAELAGLPGDVGDAHPWHLGDWVCRRDRVRREGKVVDSSMPSLVAETAGKMGLAPQHVRHAPRVAKAFPLERRRARLTWAIHKVVASVNGAADQDRLPARAAAPPSAGPAAGSGRGRRGAGAGTEPRVAPKG